ncbi:hypothetical protein HDU80_011586, partial [Chytriomyces hyalinus]
MPPLEIIGSSFLTQPVSTASCVSTDTVLSKPATAVIPTLESMPPEILDLIASFVDGISILQLCHAVRYYKYISQAMFDIGYPLTLQTSQKFVQLNFWPCAYLQKPSDCDVFATMPIAASHMHAFQTYSNILSKHGGYASIDATAMTMVGALPKNVEVEVGHATPSPVADKFFGALHNAKKNIWQLSFGFGYFEDCKSDPDLLVVTAKWLVKLSIHELQFLSWLRIPMEIRGMLHLMPMLKSLHLRNLGDCAGIAFSEFKMLKKLTISHLFVGELNPEELIQHVVNVLKPTKIQQMKPQCPCCQRHELAQQQMLAEVNSLRRLLQMPSFESVCSSFLSTPVSTPLCSSITSRPAPESEPLRPTVESVPWKPALASKPSKTSFGSMPLEIMDKIVSCVSGDDILQLCHAVRYYKYISTAMYAFGHRLKAYKVLGPSDFWPHLDVRYCLSSKSNPRLHGLWTYSRILSKHGGCARISYHKQIVAVLDHLLESLQVLVEDKCSLQDMDDLFAVLYHAKKVVKKLDLGEKYLKHFVTDAATLKMMANWFTYSNILSKHGGYASIDSTGMTVLGDLPENVEVEVGCATPSPSPDKFFGALYNAKKNIWQLSLGLGYLAGCESDPSLLDMTAKWLVKLRIHELQFLSWSSIPTEIRGMLHLMPMLKSLHLRNLGDCAGIAFSEFKMLKKLTISHLFVGELNPEELIQHVVNILKPTKIQQMKPKCPCCQRHELAQQRMLDEVNSLRRLLQMPSFESVCSSFLSTPVSTALCSSIDNAPSRPAPESEPLRPAVESVPSKPALASKPSKTSFGSMPPEILDRIVSSVSGDDILQLCHAVRYYKYISAAMYAFGHRLTAYKVLGPSDFWPHLDVRRFLSSKSNPRLHGLWTYSRILSKHGGCARISYHKQIVAVLDHLPESVQVRLEDKCSSQDMDDLFAVLYRAKKVVKKLDLVEKYFEHFVSDAATLKMMAN